MNPLIFKEDCPLDLIAVGRLCVDLNANETQRPMEETRTFTKYVGDLLRILRLVRRVLAYKQDLSVKCPMIKWAALLQDT